MPKLPQHRRAVLISVLIYHYRTDDPPHVGICACGWGKNPGDLGRSWAEHIVDVFESERRVLTHA
jgi:hypothetical protein